MKKINKITVVSIFSLIFGLIGVNAVLAAGPSSINLGTAGNFEILAKTGISTTGVTNVVGDIGVSPAAATYITGFSLDLPAANAYATSSLITGKVYAPGYADPTPANISTAVSDMETAYTDGAGRTNPTATELGAGNIGGLTIAPGLYKWGTGVTIPTDVTLAGSANDVWIFQIAQNLDIASATKVILSGGARSNNVFWVVAGQTTIGTNAIFNGNILDQTAIVLNTGATLNGRALAQTAVTLDSNSVIYPSGAVVVSTPTPTPTPTTTSTTVSTSTSTSSNNNGGGSSGSSQSVITPRPTVISMPPASTFGQAISSIAGSLRAGSMGNAVKTLQEFLMSQDTQNQALKKYGLDGKFGPTTKAALIKWQLAHDLVGDGVMGPKTKAKINALAL